MDTLTTERPPQEENAPDLAPAYDGIDPLTAEWTWPDRLPVAELGVLAGPGGFGKGFVIADAVARLTTGRPMPGCVTADPPGHVIMINAEDDPHVVVGPRLRAAGADMGMVHNMSAVDGEPFCLADPSHIAALYRAVAQIGDVRMVTIDPLSACAGVTLASVHRIRQIMTPLQRFARITGASVLVAHHVTKDGKVAGSQAIKDSVKCVMLMEADDDPGIRRIMVVKTNMGVQEPEVLRYRITAGDDGAVTVEYVTEAQRPASGQDLILGMLQNRAERGNELVAGQAIAVETGLQYATVRVLCARLIAAGKVSSPARGWFSAVPESYPVSVTK